MKKVKINPKIINYLFFLGIVIVLLVGIFIILYYFNFQRNECLKDPFVYGAKQIKDIYNSEFAGFGTLQVQLPDQPLLIFNSTDSYWLKP